jgi:hypothetical protein
MKKLVILIFFFLNQNLLAAEFKGNFFQGNFILGKTNKESKVFIDNRLIRVSDEGYFAFGIDRDRKNDIKIKLKKFIKKNIKSKKLMGCRKNK